MLKLMLSSFVCDNDENFSLSYTRHFFARDHFTSFASVVCRKCHDKWIAWLKITNSSINCNVCFNNHHHHHQHRHNMCVYSCLFQINAQTDKQSIHFIKLRLIRSQINSFNLMKSIEISFGFIWFVCL